MKHKINWLGTLTFLVSAAIVILIAYCVIKYNLNRPSLPPEAISQGPMITFTELQQQLVDRGYNIKVDGRIGKETLKAWSTEICNDYYRKTIARMEKENE